MSQIDLPNPHAHRAIHERDSASIFAAQLGGRMVTKNFWMELMSLLSLRFFSGWRAESKFRP